jgi:hypothetical protein
MPWVRAHYRRLPGFRSFDGSGGGSKRRGVWWLVVLLGALAYWASRSSSHSEHLPLPAPTPTAHTSTPVERGAAAGTIMDPYPEVKGTTAPERAAVATEVRVAPPAPGYANQVVDSQKIREGLDDQLRQLVSACDERSRIILQVRAIQSMVASESPPWVKVNNRWATIRVEEQCIERASRTIDSYVQSGRCRDAIAEMETTLQDECGCILRAKDAVLACK